MKRGLLLQDLFVGVNRGGCAEPICDWQRYTARSSTTSVKFACWTNAPAPVKANSAVFLELTTRTPLRMTQVEMKSDFRGNNDGSSRWGNPSDGPSHICLHLRQQGTSHSDDLGEIFSVP
ncbi:uncharacterized protein LOC144173657 isoform X1 [Haemaphysalis longicornis]